jgi:flagellar hook-associated protein 3 FlgL
MALSDFRIPNQMLATNSLSDLQQSFAKLADLQDQAASGKKLRRPSDSPTDTVSAMQLHAGLNANDQYARNLDDANAWLNTADTALQGMVEQLQRVRSLVINARNGANDPTARNAIANEIDSLRQSLIASANTQYGGRAIFGGTASGGVAYAADGTYVGISVPIERTIGAGQRMQVNVNGDAVFGTGSNSLFNTLSQLSDAIRNNPGSLDTLAATLDTQTTTLQSSLAEVGSRAKRVEDAQSQNTADNLTMKKNLSNVEDIDLAQVMVNLQAQQVTYQAALSATAKAIQPSLVDFLR